MRTISAALLDSVRSWRHELHRRPELAFEEHATAEFVAETLRGLGLQVSTGIAGTGVVGTLIRGNGPSIGLRSDMDALGLTEAPDHDHLPASPGRMHACGHDGHMAMLLGSAAHLAQQDSFSGTVHFVFQPAEEPGRGAQAMIDDGLFERFGIETMYGLHNMPGIPAGYLHTRPGMIMAGEDNFTIDIMGSGGHAARPQMVIDPIVIASQIILALQSIVARNLDPADLAVVSCTNISTDGARNAIPSHVRITGDTRSSTPRVQKLLEERIRTISHGIATAAGAQAQVSYTHEFRPTINSPQAFSTAVAAAKDAVGEDHVDTACAPVMASEDFGIYAEHVPACFVFIGNGTEDDHGGKPLHSGVYEFNDDALTAGIRFYTSLVHHHLGEHL